MLSRFWGSSAPPAGSLAALSLPDRTARMMHANSALNAVMNDHMDLANRLLKEHDDAFHLTGRAIAKFLEAMLGGEPAGIMEAGTFLDEARVALETEMAHSVSRPDELFHVGSAYRVILANVLLMSALVGFVSQRVAEAMRSVWKLKKAYGIFYALHGHIKAHDLDAKFASIHEEQLDQVQSIDYQTYCAALAGYGMQTLIISLLPPKLSRILSLVGFKGSRTEGLTALWSVAEAPNIQGALSLLGILLYYGGVLHFCDIAPDASEDMLKCERLLQRAKVRYPDSAIWQLQAARLQLLQGQLSRGIQMLEDISTESQMKQIASLKLYDLGLSHIYAMHWDRAVEIYVLVEAGSTWSKSAYSYIRFMCIYEQWRVTKDASLAAQATELLNIAQATGGQKKMMGSPIPLEMVILRKHARWLALSKQRGCSLLEAVDGCPAAEFLHLFNGWKSMPHDLLEAWLALLPADGLVDSQGVMMVLRATILRNLARFSEAEETLAPTLALSKYDLRDIPHPEQWFLPFAYYEEACILWKCDGLAAKDEARTWILRARNFGESELESRLDIRLTTALGTLL